MSTRPLATRAILSAALAALPVLGAMQPAGAAGIVITVPVDTTALSAKGYLPGWLAIDAKCDLFGSTAPGALQIPGKIGSGVTHHVPATAGPGDTAKTMVKVLANENTPGIARHARYSCTASVESITGSLPLHTKGAAVTGPIEGADVTTAPIVLTLFGSNRTAGQFDPTPGRMRAPGGMNALASPSPSPSPSPAASPKPSPKP